MTDMALTDRQQEVYDFICKSIKKKTYSPTVREIAEEFGIRSPNGVVAHLRALVRKGRITREVRMSRGIRLVGGPDGVDRCPVCGGKMKGGKR